jgi:hypothetical protein
MAEETGEVAVSAPPRMDGVQLPRRVTMADVPRLSDRIRQVWNTDGQHRSGPEWVVHGAALLIVIVATLFMWASSDPVAQKVTESLAVLVAALLVATPVLLRMRFRS